MVKVTVLFEGGNPNESPNVGTAGNDVGLREAFNTLLNAGLKKEQVEIIAEPIYSNRNLKSVVANWVSGKFVLIDLDAPESHKATFIQNQELTLLQDYVFFMVQEMEAWILSQPEVIEHAFLDMKSSKTPVAKDDALQVQHPSMIRKPSRTLQTILGRHFEYEKAGRLKKLKYGKLKHGPHLLQSLDVELLKATFDDLRSMLTRIDAVAG